MQYDDLLRAQSSVQGAIFHSTMTLRHILFYPVFKSIKYFEEGHLLSKSPISSTLLRYCGIRRRMASFQVANLDGNSTKNDHQTRRA